MRSRDATLSAIPSRAELDAFFISADQIQRVPESEDTDEGIANFLLRARESANAGASTEPDAQSSLHPSNFPPIAASTALGSPSFRYSARDPLPGRNEIRNISTTSPTLARPAKGETGTVTEAAMEVPKPKARRSSSAPKKTDNFELRLPEYALWIQENYNPSAHGKAFDFQALKDQTVFLAVSDVGKPKIERERLITIRRLGGAVASSYDPAVVTMVVTTNKAVDSNSVARLLGVPSMSAVPAGIKVVLWDWVVECQHAEAPEIPVGCNRYVLYEDRHRTKKATTDAKQPAPAAKVAPVTTEAGPSRVSSKRRKKVDDADSDFSDRERKEREAQRRKLSLSRADQLGLSNSDPLQEFYEEAQAQLVEEHSSQEDSIFAPKSESDDGSSDEEEFVKLERATKGFACLEPPRELNEEMPNQFIIDKLKELKDIYASKQGDSDHFKVFNLNKVIGDLSRLKTKITTRKEALALNGSGKKTADKIMEIIETGDLRRIKSEDTEEYRVIKLFAGIYDVGAKRALKWYQMGLRTLEDVEARKEEIRLTSRQAIGLKYYSDLQQRIPRHEAAAIFEKIRQIAMSIDGNLTLYIMGSFRRGAETCGDIDLLLTRDPADGITHAGVLHRLLGQLHAHGILTEDLSVPDDDGNLEAKYMGLCRLSARGKMRRIDMLTIPWEQKGAALIYFTGDDIFNRSLRLLAHKKGYSLNQRGLYGGIARDPKTRAKTTEGVIVASNTEEEIFAVLGVPYRPPHERRRA